ncbi:MAG: LPS export ABC transporter permease LptF [Gammaproteobacteria bacterium]|jgi:lipopolysaccharide export system permease protein
MQVLTRYLLREVTISLLGVVSVLLLIIVGNLLAQLLAQAGTGIVTTDALLPLLALSSVKALIQLTPVSLLIAIMLTMGRWYRDSEVYALHAAGIGYGRLYRMLFQIGVPLSLLLAFASLYLMPMLDRQFWHIREQVAQRSELVGIEPGRFIQSKSDNRVLFIESISKNADRMGNVFIYSNVKGRDEIVTASEASQSVKAGGAARFLRLEQGHRYEGVPGEGSFTITNFKDSRVRMPAPPAVTEADRLDTTSTEALLKSHDPRDQAELQWRLAIPISTLILTLLALPLSYAAPRQGRFGKMALGILVYVIYANLILLSKSWIAHERMPEWVGIWWVHGVMFLLALLLIVHRYSLGWLLNGWRKAA